MFCLRQKILIESMIEYTLKKINMITNKLDRYTFILCFVKIYIDGLNYRSRPKLLKFLIILCLYLQSLKYDINNNESLTLLYIISKKYIIKDEEKIIQFDNCILEERKDNFMKIIIIRRYCNFFILNQDNLSNILTNLESSQKYYSLLWIIVKCCIITIYKFFDFKLN